MKKSLVVALKSLTQRQGEIIHMYYYQNKKIPQIALELGLNKSTVQRHLESAHNKLKSNITIMLQVA